MSELSKQKPEVPVIIIERDDEPAIDIAVDGKKRQWLRHLANLAVGLLMLALLFAAYKLAAYYFVLGVPVSTSPRENIEKLKQPATGETAEVRMTSDSILGVTLDIYVLHGLKADIELREPDKWDRGVFLYSRCADYTSNGKYLGSLVVQGQDLQSDRSRLGYMAMADGQMVIGISRSDKVKDYVCGRGGSFFRQFILVSDGVLPPRFMLHGKVERRAIGRIGNQLFYIATRQKETLWDFADALREYGFTDAIYITGGNQYGFYRDRNGNRHDFGQPAARSRAKGKNFVPWLVFRALK